MNEERKMILQMLQDGVITAAEAENLLDAIPAENRTRADARLAVRQDSPVVYPKKISVRVTEGERTRINVSLPFSLIRAGLTLGKAAGTMGFWHARDEERAVIRESLKNIDVDELLASLHDGVITLPYVMVDMDDGEGQHVEITLS
jgi:hypothetical protein